MVAIWHDGYRRNIVVVAWKHKLGLILQLKENNYLIIVAAVGHQFLPCIVLMHSNPWKSHSLMLISAEHEANSFPVWSKEMSCTESV